MTERAWSPRWWDYFLHPFRVADHIEAEIARILREHPELDARATNDRGSRLHRPDLMADQYDEDGQFDDAAECRRIAAESRVTAVSGAAMDGLGGAIGPEIATSTSPESH